MRKTYSKQIGASTGLLRYKRTFSFRKRVLHAIAQSLSGYGSRVSCPSSAVCNPRTSCGPEGAERGFKIAGASAYGIAYHVSHCSYPAIVGDIEKSYEILRVYIGAAVSYNTGCGSKSDNGRSRIVIRIGKILAISAPAVKRERAKAGEPLTLVDLETCGAPKF